MIRFIHTADIHFGMENYGRIDPQTGIHTRLLDFDKALTACVDYAISNKVDFFLFAGDAYKTATPSPTQQRLFLRCFLKLYQAQIPVVIIVGNHDHPMSFGKAHALDIFNELPVDGFHVIDKPKTTRLITKNGPVSIVGIPWPTRSAIALQSGYQLREYDDITLKISAALAHSIQEQAAQLNPEEPAVLAGHLTVASGIFSGSEKRAIYGNDPVLLTSQLAIQPFDYVALGHLHRHQNLNEGGHPAVVYSGSLERIDFGERKDQKGFCDVQIHDKNHTTYNFIPVPTRPFIQIEISLHSAVEQTQILVHKLSEYNLHNAVVKIIYHLHNGVRDNVHIPTIMNACSQAHYVVGIFPVHAQVVKERRTIACSSSQSLQTIVQEYFSNKHDLKHKTEQLTQKILMLADSQVDS